MTKNLHTRIISGATLSCLKLQSNRSVFQLLANYFHIKIGDLKLNIGCDFRRYLQTAVCWTSRDFNSNLELLPGRQGGIATVINIGTLQCIPVAKLDSEVIHPVLVDTNTSAGTAACLLRENLKVKPYPDDSRLCTCLNIVRQVNALPEDDTIKEGGLPVHLIAIFRNILCARVVVASSRDSPSVRCIMVLFEEVDLTWVDSRGQGLLILFPSCDDVNSWVGAVDAGSLERRQREDGGKTGEDIAG